LLNSKLEYSKLAKESHKKRIDNMMVDSENLENNYKESIDVLEVQLQYLTKEYNQQKLKCDQLLRKNENQTKSIEKLNEKIEKLEK